MKFQFLSILFATLILYSCGTTQHSNMETNNATESSITETFWVLETFDGEKVISSQIDSEIGFTLNAAENQVTGFSGCNRFFGSYTLDTENKIKFSGLGATKMACPDSDFDENEFLKMFSEVNKYKFVGDRLELLAQDKTPLASFRKVNKTDNAITEKYWKLTVLEGNKVEMASNQEREAYFILKTQENRVTGFAGCNTFSGSYSLEEGNRIRFRNMATTMKACPDVNFDESDFLKVFELADNYSINDDTLTLNVGKRSPLAVFKAVYFN